MKFKTIFIALLIVNATSIFADLKVITTYPYIADLTKKIGKDKVSVEALARGFRDPHYIVPKPSLIAKTRRADLVIINGGDLEIGWMPPVLNAARNADVQPGEIGFLDLSSHVKMIQVPDRVSRSQGDIHPLGNPHYNLSPDNIPILARVIKNKLCEMDNDNCSSFTANYNSFNTLWQKKILEWKETLKPLKGKKIVQYHRIFDYFMNFFGIKIVGELEPLPGIPPTSKHITKVIRKVKDRGVSIILQDVYHPKGPSTLVSKKTGVKVAVIPHDVKAVSEARDIISLFDEIVRRLVHD